jgi:hypothetical protein
MTAEHTPHSEPTYESVSRCWCENGECHYKKLPYDEFCGRMSDLEEQMQELVKAARPFGEMAQEMITGHQAGHLPKGAAERLLAALKAVDGD